MSLAPFFRFDRNKERTDNRWSSVGCGRLERGNEPPQYLNLAQQTGTPCVGSTTEPTSTHVWQEPNMKTGLIIVGAVLAAVALCDARSPPRPQVCTADWKPVCGVDNKTYGNVCMAKAKQTAIQADRRTDGRQTIGVQKGSTEL
uniref:Uncharacterized protein n=1 Tax=Magallana gigas TaxID=29159 RepID=K1Q7L2_MAGGI